MAAKELDKARDATEEPVSELEGSATGLQWPAAVFTACTVLVLVWQGEPVADCLCWLKLALCTFMSHCRILKNGGWCRGWGTAAQSSHHNCHRHELDDAADSPHSKVLAGTKPHPSPGNSLEK